MRILLLAQFYPPMIGGEERHVRNLATEFARRGHDVHVGTLRLGPDDVRPQDPGVTVHELDNAGRHLGFLYEDASRPMSFPAPDPVVTRALKALVEQIRPDVVHAHNWIVNSYLPIAGRAGVPLVYSLHDYSHVCATKRMMRDGQPCPGAGAACIGCSSRHYGVRGLPVAAAVTAGRPARRKLVDLFTPVSRHVARANELPGADGSTWSGDGWQVVPNFVPDDLAERAAAAPTDHLPDRPYLFFAGDLSDEKGLGVLLRAHRLLRERGVDVPELVAAGRATPSTPATDPEGVTLHRGGWEHDKVLAGFAGARVAVVPSRWPDPCPTTVLEAMATGTALVTTPMGGISDMVDDGVSALVVPPDNAPALADALARLLGDEALRVTLGEGGRKAVQAFSCGQVADTFEDAYTALLGSQPASAETAAAAGTKPAAAADGQRPLTVTMVSAQAFPVLGGIESHMDEVVRRLVAQGHTVNIVASDRSHELPRRGQRNGATIRRYNSYPSSKDWYASPGLGLGLLRTRQDLVHIQGIHNLVPPVAMLACILTRKPFVLSFHTGGHTSAFRNRSRGLQFRLLAPLLRRATELIAVSQWEADIFEPLVGRPIRVIRNGGVTVPDDLEVTPDPDLIVSVGRLERYKGHHRAIEALPLLLQKRPGLRLRILGAGPYEGELRALAERIGVADRVTITLVPATDRDAMARELASAGVVSLLSDYESHPVAVMEALAVARPVLVLENSGLTELVRQGLIRGLPDGATTRQIADALDELIDAPVPDHRAQLPTWDGCVGEVVETYRKALTAR